MKRNMLLSGGIAVLAALLAAVIYLDKGGGGPDAQQAMVLTKAAEPQGVPTSYGVTVQMLPDRRTVKGTLEVIAENTSKDTLDAIYFHLYPNTFRDDSKLTGENWDYVAGKMREPGWIDITNVRKNDVSAIFNVEGTIMKIPAEGWKPGEKLHLTMDFTIRIPVNGARLSLDEHIVYFGNWLPIRAVYDDKGWNLDPYYPMGDPFYSDAADYKVHVSIPKEYQFASTGTEGEQTGKVNGKYRSFDAEAKKVRDFAMVVMDSEYQHLSQKAGDVTVRSWYRKTDNQTAVNILHTTALQSIDFYSQAWGQYPYAEYDVIRTSGFFGGMEYPGLVYIQGQVYSNPGDPSGVIDVAHETGHQWWYSLVGNNEVAEPWIDESLTQYATLRYLDKYNSSIYSGYLDRLRQKESKAGSFETGGVGAGSSVDKFPNWDAYGTLVYYKGADMFLRLSEAVGKDKMDAALKKYFNAYEYKNAKASDLLNAMAQELGPDAKAYFDTWLTKGTAEFGKSGK